MADLLNSVSSFLKKFKGKPHLETPPEEFKAPPQLQEKPPTPVSLESLSDDQLRDFIQERSEHAVVRILHETADPDLQLRIVKSITHEATLKRVARIEINKKAKRLAEKMLRETGTAIEELRAQKAQKLSDEMRSFLRSPNWTEAQDLLSRAFESDSPSSDFQDLRGHLKAEIEEFEKTCAEMEKICEQINSQRSLPRHAFEKLQNRWKDLEEKYTFPKTFTAPERFKQLVQARLTAPQPSAAKAHPAPAPVPAPVIQAKTVIEPVKNPEEDRKREEARTQRGQAFEKLQHTLEQISGNLGERHAGSRLRQLQTELGELRRWKRDFGKKFDEAESLARELTLKRKEVVNEGQWDEWARTDRASRILAELEKSLTEIEADPESDASFKSSFGLGQRIFDYSKEMKALGALDKEKDHKIWEQFKTLCDRGWAITEKMRIQVQEKTKALLSEYAVNPIDFSVATLSAPRAVIEFKVAAFEPEVSARVRELQSYKNQVIGKKNAAAQEAETISAKLFEIYFRQLNLHLGQIRRVELGAVQKKQDVLLEMKRACESKMPSLLERTKATKRLEERWKKDPLPESASAKLQEEFDGYQSKLAAELAAEIERQAGLASETQLKIQAILDKIQAKDGANLSQVLKSISALEGETQGLEKNLKALNEMRPDAASGPQLQETFTETKHLLAEATRAAKEELAERANERGKVLSEAEELALSTDEVTGRTRLDELKALWKKVGAIGQADDSRFDLLFENICRFYLSRSAASKESPDSAKKEKATKQRMEFLLSLDALSKLMASKAGLSTASQSPPLPFDDVTRAKAAGKVLELGLKYRQILSLNPEGGILKETKNIMTQWSQLGTADEQALPAFWKYYLNRVRALLEIK